jgi:hypothetical protein
MRATFSSLASALLYLSMLTAAGCVEKNQDELGGAKLSDVRFTTKPTPAHPLDIRFGDKVRLLGYDVSVAEAAPDKPFTVTWYWQVEQTLGDGWDIFTHVGDATNTNRLNLDATRIVRRLHPVSRWKSGEFIKDSQEVTLPANWGSNAAVFYIGFYKGDQRMPVTQGKHDNDKRAEALKLPVGKPGALVPRPLARIIARRATGPITLDGKLDEGDWKEAEATASFVNTMNGDIGSFEAKAQVLYDDKNIYVGFVVADDYLKAPFQNQDDHLWENDTVEVMVDPDGDTKNYFEIQVSPRNVSFDTRYESPRKPRPFGDMAWSSQVRAGVSVDGTIDDEDADRGYVVELAMPYTAFATGATPATPPNAGDTWRMNFFVMDSRSRGQRAVGWSAPLVGDFHTLSRFGRVVFPAAAQAADSPTTRTAPTR